MFTRPDNSIYQSNVISSDIDLAEHAARIGINRLRRNGRVIFLDDFASGISWNIGAGFQMGVYSAYGTNSKPFTPPGMMVIVPNTGLTAGVSTRLPMVSSPIIGIEVTLQQDSNWLPQTVQNFGIRIEGNSSAGGIRINLNTNEIEYLNLSGTWVTVPGSTYIDDYGWINFKLVINLQTQEYIKLYYDRNILDLSGIKLYNVGISNYILTSFSVLSSAVRPVGAIFDNVIITTDEG